MARTLRFLSVAVTAIALLAGACGSGRSDEGASPAGTDDGATTTTADGTFGTLESPCGPGDASGATDQGVTDESITIGFGDDAGYQASPGLDHEVSDAMRAFIDWCNEQGGINGRRIEGNYYDAKITEVTNVITEACEKDFMLVGEYWVLDDAQEPVRRECGLPAVPAAAGTATFANAPLKVEAVSSAIDRASVYGGLQLADTYPDAVQRAGVLWGDYPVIRDRKDQVQEAFSTIGWTFDPECSVSYNVQGEADWKPLVQRLKDCGAEVVYFVGSPYPNFQNTLDAANQLDVRPVWYADTNAYDPTFSAWNADGLADDVYFRMAYLPFEEADTTPAIQQYLDLVEASGGDTSQLGEQAASSFLLWATAAKACGSDLTRECVMDELSSIHEWTGGGLHAPADPGANEPSECGLLIRMQGTEFVRVSPEEPGTFDCAPENVYDMPLSSEVLTRNNIGADRIAQL